MTDEDSRARTEDEAPEPARGSSKRLRTFESLRYYPLFRWYMLSMSCHWSALQMEQLIRGFLVFELTGSFAALGLLALMQALPRLLLALIGGVLADRLSKRYIVQCGQATTLLVAGGTATLIFFDALVFGHLLVAAVIQGTANSMLLPSRQAMIPSLVEAERVTNAVALEQGARNTMRLLMPALGGLLIALVGPAWVYVFMSGLYLLAVSGLFRLPPLGPAIVDKTERSPGAARQGLRDVADGLRYVGRNRPLILLLLLHLCIGIFAMPYQRMLPGFVDNVLGEGATVLGILMALTGGGALLGSLVIASLPPHRRGRNLLISAALFGGALTALSFSTVVWAAAGFVMLLGAGQASRRSLNMALVHSNVTDAYRGRVMSLYMMELGLISLGAFGLGLVAEVIGIQLALGGAAIIMLGLVVAAYLFVPDVRRMD